MKENTDFQQVSIIIVSYNNLCYIFETIDSILMQNYPNIELIISDDHSVEFNNNTYFDYITKNNKGNIKNLIVHRNECNLGTVKNFNNAIKMSKGSIIKLIAADDALYNEFVITSFVKFIEINQSSLVVSQIAMCDENLNILNNIQFNKIVRPLLTNFNQHKCFIQICKGSFIPAPSVCFEKKIFDKYGLFDETYHLLEDWPMWIRLIKDGCKIDYLDEITVKYRTNVGISMTPNEMFNKDYFQCIKNEILPYEKELGYWLYKKTKWNYIKGCEYNKYTVLNKTKFIVKNIDIILFYLIPNKVINKCKYLLFVYNRYWKNKEYEKMRG